MKKSTILFVCVGLLLSLAACGSNAAQSTTSTTIVVTFGTTTEPTTVPTTAPTTEPTTAPTTEPTTAPTTEPTTAPLHSPLYIPGLDVEDVITYFNEVCLDAEFSNGGDPDRLQKWENTIYYQLNGAHTKEDLATLKGLAAWLNVVDGFPGLYESSVDDPANLQIYFCTQSELVDKLGQDFVDTDGGVTFWYNYLDQIYEAIICYSTEIDQQLRNSVILEEIYNGLGPIQDTSLREDSIIYSGFSDPQALTAVDKLIMQLLYHPEMKCGMNAEECEAVIRKLYY